MTPDNTIIFVNPYCHGGKGWKRWLSIRDEVYKLLPPNLQQIVLEKGTTLADTHIDDKKTLLISAGGDGSIHYLVNHVMKHSVQNIVVGAIGLGSSNDFLKPFGYRIHGIPVRLNQREGFLQHDLGLAYYLDKKGQRQHKYFIVNASAGVTAEANQRYNNPGPLLSFLKKYASGASIIYTAIRTILSHKNRRCKIAFNGANDSMMLSNLNVLKIPFVSGSFFYDQPIARDDGQLSLNLCRDMSRRELMVVLSKLEKGISPQTRKTVSAFTQNISITADQPFVFECDGETEHTTSLDLSIRPHALAVLKG